MRLHAARNEATRIVRPALPMLRRAALLLALLGLALVALAARSTSLPDVFDADGRVYLDIHDSAYHARVAYWDFVNFPSALRFDPWMAYPDGAPVPNPVLFDWAVAGAARLVGPEPRDFEWTAAWVSPLLATLQTGVVFAMGRLLGGSGLGLAAAAIFAVFPASLRRSQVGDLDHHAAVALLGALLLWASLALARGPKTRRHAVGAAAGLAAALVAMLLSWSGSLLYAALCQGALLLTACLENRRDLLFAQSGSAFGAAAAVGLWLAVASTPSDAAFATTTLSWFHVVALVVAGGTGGLLAAVLGRRPLEVAGRLGAGAAIGAALCAAALAALPELVEALRPSLSFLSGGDAWAAHNPEQQPLFRSDRAMHNFGLLGHMLPLLILGPAILVHRREPLAPGLCLLCWTLVLGTLALFQIRFSGDLAAVASLSLAVMAREGSRWLAGRAPLPLARVVAAAAVAVLLLPGWEDASSFERALAHARGEASPGERMDARRTLAVFAEMVRDATPEDAEPERPGARPDYAVLAPASFGHTLHYYARRATPANNFGPYLDLEKFQAVRRFYDAREEAEAVAIAEALGTRYVMTYAHEVAHRELFAFSLHQSGRPVGEGHVERLRLVVEGPADGAVFAQFFPGLEMPEETLPYKLFELVPGALLEARGAPGTELVAELEAVSNLGRRFRVTAATRADADGIARLRVPYSTPSAAARPTRATGPYRLRFGTARGEASVREADVQAGRVVRVQLGAQRSPES